MLGACRLDRLLPLSGGAHGRVYEIVDLSRDERLILKLYPKEHAWEMEQEEYVNGLLRQVPEVPVPRVLLTRPGSPWEHARSYPTNQEWINAKLDAPLSQVSSLNVTAIEEGSVRRFLTERSHALAGCHGAVLCHGDLHEGNVLAARSEGTWQITGVIDVGGAIAGDPMFDLARTLYWATRGNPIK